MKRFVQNNKNNVCISSTKNWSRTLCLQLKSNINSGNNRVINRKHATIKHKVQKPTQNANLMKCCCCFVQVLKKHRIKGFGNPVADSEQ